MDTLIIFIAYPQQQSLHKHASVFHFMYIAYLVYLDHFTLYFVCMSTDDSDSSESSFDVVDVNVVLIPICVHCSRKALTIPSPIPEVKCRLGQVLFNKQRTESWNKIAQFNSKLFL
jgi:hypothetical protein